MSTLKYIHIERILSKTVIGKYPTADISPHITKVVSDINSLLKKLSNQILESKYSDYDIRNKIETNEACYFYTINTDGVLFFLETDKFYSENKAFNFIDSLYLNEIFNFIDEDRQCFNSEGERMLKTLFEEYNQSDFKVNANNAIDEQRNELKLSKRQAEEEDSRNEIIKMTLDGKGLKKEKENESQPEEMRKVKSSQVKTSQNKENLTFSVKTRHWMIRILFIICIVVYIIIPLTINNEKTKLGSNQNGNSERKEINLNIFVKKSDGEVINKEP